MGVLLLDVDGEFASCSVGFRKPSADYFAAVGARLGVLPGSILFFDDSVENVEGARAAGWDAHVYVDVEGFRRVVLERG